MIPVPSGVRVWLAAGVSDMRRGMNGLALQVQQALERDPHLGDLYVFRGRRGDLVKILWHDGLGMSLYAKRLERGHFVWPQAQDGAVSLTPAMLSMLLEGIVWTPPTGQERDVVPGLPYRVRVCVRPVDATGTAAGPDGLSAAQSPHFDYALKAHALASGKFWSSVRLAVHHLLRLGLAEVASCHRSPVSYAAWAAGAR